MVEQLRALLAPVAGPVAAGGAVAVEAGKDVEGCRSRSMVGLLEGGRSVCGYRLEHARRNSSPQGAARRRALQRCRLRTASMIPAFVALGRRHASGTTRRCSTSSQAAGPCHLVAALLGSRIARGPGSAGEPVDHDVPPLCRDSGVLREARGVADGARPWRPPLQRSSWRIGSDPANVVEAADWQSSTKYRQNSPPWAGGRNAASAVRGNGEQTPAGAEQCRDGGGQDDAARADDDMGACRPPSLVDSIVIQGPGDPCVRPSLGSRDVSRGGLGPDPR